MRRLALLALLLFAMSTADRSVKPGVAGVNGTRAAAPAIADQVAGAFTIWAVRDGVLVAGEGPRVVTYDAKSLARDGRLRRLGASEVLPGAVSALTPVGDRRLLAALSGVGLALLETTDTGEIGVVDVLRSEGISREPEVRDGIAYATACPRGLLVVDLRDPDGLVELATVPLEVPGDSAQLTCATEISAGPGHLYVFFGESRPFGGQYLAVLDLADPALPRVAQISKPTDLQVRTASVFGRYLLGIIQNDLAVFDLSDPMAPVLSARHAPTPNYYADGLVLDGTRAFVNTIYAGAEARSGMAVLDIADPEAPRELGFLPMSGDVGRPAIGGGHAFVVERYLRADGVYSLHAVDLADLAAPRSVASAPVPDAIDLVAARRDAVFAVSSSGRLWSMRLEADGSFSTPVPAAVPWRAEGIALLGNALVAGAGGDGLRLLDATDAEHLREMGTLMPGATTGLQFRKPVVDGQVAYVLGYVPSADREVDPSWSLHVVDLAAPASPREMATLPLPPDVNDLAVRDGRAVVAGNGGLEIIDVTDPARPTTVRHLDIGVAVTHVALGADHVAYVTVINALRVYDLSNPTEARLLADVPLPGPAHGDQYALAVDGTSLFVTVRLESATVEGFRQLLIILDARDPRHLEEITRTGLPGRLGVRSTVAPAGSHPGLAYVAAGTAGLIALRWRSAPAGAIQLPWLGR